MPLCRNCVAVGNCPKCGDWVDTIAAAKKPRDNELDTDSDDDDDYNISSDVDCSLRYDPDIRVHPPRFTPLGRTGGRNTDQYWELQNDKWLHPINAPLTCSGCDSAARLRVLTRVVVIQNQCTTRYLHRLCGRCVRAITYRRQEIIACSPNSNVTIEWLPLKHVPAPPAPPLMLVLTDPEPDPPKPFDWTG